MRVDLNSDLVSVSEFFAAGRFLPATVQRAFKWGPSEALRLIEDIWAAARAAQPSEALQQTFEETAEAAEAAVMGERLEDDAAPLAPAPAVFFAGSMILRPRGHDQYEIFDGLQRLTTLTIALAVLRDLLEDHPVATELAACVAAPGSETALNRLHHATDNPTLVRFVQKPGEAKRLRRESSAPEAAAERRIFDIQVKLARLFRREAHSALKDLAVFLLQNVQINRLSIKDAALARHAFIATNQYGAPLRRDDVFKGEFLSIARDAEAEARMLTSWERIADQTGDGLGAFLSTIAMLTRPRVKSLDPLADLANHIRAKAEAGRLDLWLERLERYAAAWGRLQHHLARPAEGRLGNLIWRMNFFRWPSAEWLPLALCWMEQHLSALERGADPNRATTHRFAQLGRRCLVITLYEFGAVRRAEIFAKAVRLAMQKRPVDPFTATENTTRPLNFSRKVRQDVKARLRLPIEDREIRRTILLWHEAALWEQGEAPRHIASGTVEHLLPHKPDRISEWRTLFGDEETRYLCVHALGNMCLVDYEVNMEMGNRSFDEKKQLIAQHDQHRKYRTTRHVLDAQTWDKAEIERRTNAMAATIWAELKLPEP